MCKVSTLRHVEPAPLKLPHSNQLLPKIEETHYANEHVGGYDGILELKRKVSLANVCLPSLVDNKLPELTSPATVKRKIIFRLDEDAIHEIVADDVELVPTRSISAERRSSFASSQDKENIPVPRKPSECMPASSKLLQRRRLHKVCSMPLMQSQSNESCQGFESYQQLSPSPPKTPKGEKRRPSTPFVLSKSHSSVRLMQAWVEEANDAKLGEQGKDQEGILRRKCVNQEKESFPKVAARCGKQTEEMATDKIRMDHSAFKKWITEQRAC